MRRMYTLVSLSYNATQKLYYLHYWLKKTKETEVYVEENSSEFIAISIFVSQLCDYSVCEINFMYLRSNLQLKLFKL